MSPSRAQACSIAAVSFLAAFLLGGTSRLHAETAAPEVRIGYSDGSASARVIRSFGWAEQEFSKSGTKVRWVHVDAPDAAFALIVAGKIDLLLSSADAVVAARGTGLPVKVVSISNTNHSGEAEVLTAAEALVDTSPSLVERAVRVIIRADAWRQKNAAEQSAAADTSNTRDSRSFFREVAAKLVAQGTLEHGVNPDRLVDGLLLLAPAARIATLYPNGTTR